MTCSAAAMFEDEGILLLRHDAADFRIVIPNLNESKFVSIPKIEVSGETTQVAAGHSKGRNDIKGIISGGDSIECIGYNIPEPEKRSGPIAINWESDSCKSSCSKRAVVERLK